MGFFYQDSLDAVDSSEETARTIIPSILFPGRMILKPKSLQRNVERLQRLLKQLQKLSAAEDVHRLRTQICLLEAIAPVLMGNQAEDRRLIRPLLQLRKAAGKVRDLDVFLVLCSSLPDECGVESREHLSECLREMRAKAGSKLRDLVGKKQANCFDGLKQFEKLIQNLRKSPQPSATTAHKRFDPENTASSLWAELAGWPCMTSDRIHSYRKRVKKLRYLLQSTQDGDLDVIRRLSQVKDAIGEWHDWNELSIIAADVLDHTSAHQLLGHIRHVVGEKFVKAVSLTDEMRQACFGSPDPTASQKSAGKAKRTSPLASSKVSRPGSRRNGQAGLSGHRNKIELSHANP